MSLLIESLNHQILDGKHTRDLLSDISLSVSPGECVALMGDSGCGKTTLLNLIAGLEPIQRGDIKVGDLLLAKATEKALSALRKNHLGIIFQQYNLLSGLSVRDNIEFSARLAGRYDPLFFRRLTEQLDITSLLDFYPATLSGGEMQRVAIARALSAQPALLLADEPTGNLDEHNSARVVTLLAELAKFHHTALLLVTHSSHVAREMDKTYRLAQGKLTKVHWHR
ncbi:ABC transporter ATP-binding protein [Psychromonas sp.]|uniref:ABC transporter ATP-binding protein n=1 Tax=Psychromonas sp. TaxID=1884585 RepID=UPI00356A15EA